MSQDQAARDGAETRTTIRRREPDAHGQAALLLAESMLHALVERGLLTSEQAAAVVQVASEVKEEVAETTAESPGTMQASLRMLSRIELSLGTDGNDRN